MRESCISPKSTRFPYSRLIDRMVDYAEKAHQEKNAANYAYTSDILKGAAIGAKGSKGAKGGNGAKGVKGWR